MTEYVLSTHAYVDRSDNRWKPESERKAPAVAFHLRIGKREKLEQVRLTIEQAYEMAESLLHAANVLRSTNSE